MAVKSYRLENHKFEALIDNPYRVLALSFIIVMLLGSLILMLPIASKDGTSTDFVDALFTSVSCVAVTGLSVVDTYKHWSLFGQIVMVILIQLGGLGIITFTTLIATVVGRKIGLRERLMLQEAMGQGGIRGLIRLVLKIIKFTFVIEFIGGVVYSIQLFPYFGTKAIYYGFTQAISSFCNAGFVFFDNNMPYQMVGDWLFTFNTSALIILGGIGFIVIFDVLKNWQRGFVYLSLHSKLMIISTIILLVGSFLLFLLLEWTNPLTLGHMTFWGKVQASIFQAVTPRTAGLSTINYGDMHDNTLFLTIILMFIGAGPASTGGGVKVATVVVLFLAARNLFTGKQDIQLFERTISPQAVYRAMAIILFSSCLILVGIFLLTSLEHIKFIDIMFEVTSAFGTVGLSTGITASLSVTSKWVLIFLMYSGRVGVLTLFGSLAMKHHSNQLISYPEGHIIV